MLTLSGAVGVAKDNLDVAPGGAVVEAEVDVVLKGNREAPHEGGAGGDDIAIELSAVVFRRRDFDSFALKLPAEGRFFTFPLLRFLGSAETAAALLVHLSARCDTIDGHVQELARADYAEKAVDVLEDVAEHLGLRSGVGTVLGVETRVDDAVHVQIEAIVPATSLTFCDP